MGFNDLAAEILRQILRDAITVRGLKRGLRLRLINSKFDKQWMTVPLIARTGRLAAEVIKTIYTYRMLDEHLSDVFALGPSALPPFVESYLEHRLHNVDDDSEQYPLLSAFRCILHDVASENEDLEYEDCVCIMCEAIAFGGVERVHVLFQNFRLQDIWLGQTDDQSHGDHYVANVHLVDMQYFTAIMTNTTSVIERIAERSYHPGQDFAGVPMIDFRRLLARYANLQTISQLYFRGDSVYAINTLNDIFIATTAEGRLSTVRMLHDHLVDADLWDLKDRNRRYKTKEVFKTALQTPSKDVWDFIMEKREHLGLSEDLRESYKTELLGECILQGGDLAMIAHLLDLGAEVDGKVTTRKALGLYQARPLIFACIYGDEDVVKLLLVRGANTQGAVAAAASKGHATIVRLLLDHGADPGDALLEASRGGYMVIVGMLLDVGASPAGVDENEHRSGRLGGKGMRNMPIACAVAMEHVEMTMALAEKGALLDGHARKACVRAAREEGLESMMALLGELGVGEA